jgi:hypothetical protein
VLQGVLIAESLRSGAELDGVPLHVIKIERIDVDDAAAEQPPQWTLLHFTAPDTEAEPLAGQLAACLAPTGGWYVSYTTAAETFVVFPGKIFRYPRGHADGRDSAKDYGRSLGIPDSQLDWQD